jgi:hypothetical protein
LDCYRAEYIACSENSEDGRLETRWLRPTELANYPLSSTGRILSNLAHLK